MIKLINYSGGFQDNYRALIVTKDGRKLVFNVINPDSFTQYLSATQTSIGLTEQEHLPLQLETRSIYLDNFKMTLRVAENFARAFMFFYLVYILKRFLTTIRGGISSKCRFLAYCSPDQLRQVHIRKIQRSVQRCCRHGRKQVRGAGVRGLPQKSQEIQKARRQNPERHHHERTTRHRKDHACKGVCWRSRCELHLRVRVGT